jgi:hypothetical protein
MIKGMERSPQERLEQCRRPRAAAEQVQLPYRHCQRAPVARSEQLQVVILLVEHNVTALKKDAEEMHQ